MHFDAEIEMFQCSTCLDIWLVTLQAGLSSISNQLASLHWRYHPGMEGGKMQTDSQVEHWNSSNTLEKNIQYMYIRQVPR